MRKDGRGTEQNHQRRCAGSARLVLGPGEVRERVEECDAGGPAGERTLQNKAHARTPPERQAIGFPHHVRTEKESFPATTRAAGDTSCGLRRGAPVETAARGPHRPDGPP